MRKINQSTNRSINRSISRTTNWIINQSINQSNYHRVINQSINQSITQSITLLNGEVLLLSFYEMPYPEVFRQVRQECEQRRKKEEYCAGNKPELQAQVGQPAPVKLALLRNIDINSRIQRHGAVFPVNPPSDDGTNGRQNRNCESYPESGLQTKERGDLTDRS